MIYRLLADLVVLLHASFILFALLGGLLVLRHRRWLWLHIPAAIWAAAVVIGGWICPLTYLENALRRASAQAGYDGSFIEHYLLPLIYPPGIQSDTQLVLGLIAIGCNLLIYGFVIWRVRRR